MSVLQIAGAKPEHLSVRVLVVWVWGFTCAASFAY